MEYIPFEKGAYEILTGKISKLIKHVDELYPAEKSELEQNWIENAELARRLHISLRTLQTYRERGIIGFTRIGRKIYYRISDITDLITDNQGNMRNVSNK